MSCSLCEKKRDLAQVLRSPLRLDLISVWLAQTGPPPFRRGDVMSLNLSWGPDNGIGET